MGFYMVLPWFYPGFANKSEDVISKLEFITSVNWDLWRRRIHSCDYVIN